MANNESPITVGQKVVLVPTSRADRDLRLKIAHYGRVEGKILERTQNGICKVILPTNVVLTGYSQPTSDDQFFGKEIIVIHQSHLIPIPE